MNARKMIDKIQSIILAPYHFQVKILTFKYLNSKIKLIHDVSYPKGRIVQSTLLP